MLLSSSPALSPRTNPALPSSAGPSIPHPNNLLRLSSNGVNRLRRFGRRPKFPNGLSNADCARFRLRRKKGPPDPDMELQQQMARNYGVQRLLETRIVSSGKRIAVTNGRIRQCRQVPVDPTPFLILRRALRMENLVIRGYRDQFRALRWRSARMLAFMERYNSNTSAISALISQYRSTLPFPTSAIHSPSSHPTVLPIPPATIHPSHTPFGPSTHVVHRVGLKRTWNTAFSPASPHWTTSAAFVDSDGAAQHVAVGSPLPSADVFMMTPKKRPRI